MRLTPEQTRIIKAAVARELEPDARIWLFGSRVDDERRGGDVDLFVETRNADLLRELRGKIAIEEAVDLVPGVCAAKETLIIGCPGQDQQGIRKCDFRRHSFSTPCRRRIGGASGASLSCCACRSGAGHPGLPVSCCAHSPLTLPRRKR